MGYKVFLSHNAADGTWVKRIAEDCTQVGVEAYLYEHDPRPGQMVADKLQTAIEGCDSVVVLLTANSQFSPYVQQEVGFAKGLNKPVIPLVQPGVDQRALAMLLGAETIPFDFENPQPGLAALLRYLRDARLGKEQNQTVLALGALVETAAHARLSPSELEILRLTPDDGRILLLDHHLGKSLLLGPESLPRDLNGCNADEAAHALDGLESLMRRGLVRYEGGDLYRLTGRGFDVRKSLLSEKSPP